MDKKKALIVMQRQVLSDTFIDFAISETTLDIKVERSYAMTVLTAETFVPAVIMMEIPESGPWQSTEKCLVVCDAVKRQLPNCKVIILCPESDFDICAAVIVAKREKRIDDFLYYEASMKYLFSKLVFYAG